MSELIIKISADVKEYAEAIDQIESKTQSFRDTLGTITKTAGVAFSALTAEIGFSLKAYASQEEATQRLTNALENQGFNADILVSKYREIASAIQDKTGVDDDAIVKAQATIQSIIGQHEVTADLTQAIVDLAEAKQIDLETAATYIGKGITGQTVALQKLGITVQDNVDQQGAFHSALVGLGIESEKTITRQERMADIIGQVEGKFKGAAAATNQGIGGLRGLKNAFGDLQENIGAKFAPAFEFLIKKATEFFQRIAANQPLIDLIAAFITAGTVVSGLILTIGGAALAFLKFRKLCDKLENKCGRTLN